ncbi:hypothetical protein DXX93_18460 [Thalassotalea euphylliae]|uniref:Uncharacterized protein n=1 Tax=Thalassotalea euphylliae TaxID=1655234 RepID=A0A3E0TUK2_9GAMM|nr:hypothetical protein [Thalassotalea euphylliae]REL28351.1 hypothetical protein DXX93_18460 [Thalassotalea euphylliae]
MKCPNIESIELSSESKASLKEIQKINELAPFLVKISGGGVMLNLFAGNGAIASTYSVYSHDFEAFTRAMTVVPKIARRRIWNISGLTMLKVKNYKERKFWQAIHKGCKLN